MIGTGGYLAASGLVVVWISLIAWSAERLRRAARLDASPVAGLLAWAVIAVSLATALGLLLGALGAFGRVGLMVGAGITAALSELVWRRREGDRTPSLLGPVQLDRWALAATALVLLGWLAGIKHSWAVGLTGFDTLTYHLPFAYSFAFEDGIRHYTFVDVSYLHHFYPAGSELLHAIGLSLVERDLLTPFLNLGFAVVSLLAAWTLGGRFGSARIGMLAVVPVMISGMMLRQEAGVASSDIGAAAMVLSGFALASVATDRNSRAALPSSTAWLAVAGLAAGLGVGVKLTAAVPVVVLSVWLVWAAWRDRSLRAGLGLFVLAIAVVGLPWELRNLILAGNPVPFVHGIGPIELPHPTRGFEGRDPFSIAHYLLDPSRSAVVDYFLPGLRRSLGWAWPLILLLALLGSVWSLAKGGSRGRAVAAAALLGGAAYLVTPFSAAGPEGFPMGFAWNLRYLAPALILGLCLISGWAGALDPRGRVTRALPALLLLLAVLTTATSDVLDLWKALDLSWILGAALIGIGATALIGRPRVLILPVLLGAFGLAIFAAGLLDRGEYLERPTAETPEDFPGDRALQAAASELDGKTVGITGQLTALEQYRLRGTDFGTEVLYVGVEQPHGGFRAVRSCRELEKVVRENGIDLLAATPDRNFDSRNRLEVFDYVASAGPISSARFLRKYRTDGLVEYYRVVPGISGCRKSAG